VKQLFTKLLVLALLTVSVSSCLKSGREGDSHEAAAFGDVALQRFEQIGGDFTLVDQYGKPFTLSAQKGKAVLLFFGYLTCPDVCPTTLLELAQIRKELGKDADQVIFAFVTVDPHRDKPEKLKDYLINFDPAFLGLYGEPDEIAKVSELYKVAYKRREQPSALGYTIDHSSGTYLIDKAGDLRYIFAFGSKHPFVIKGIEKVLALP